MLPVLLLASAVASQPSAITLKQAEELSPAALADRLLTGPHRPIVEKNTAGEGGPPPPPNGPVTTEIQLWDRAHKSRESGFCEKTRYAVFLAPVMRAADGSLPPSPPARVTENTTYRWNPGRGVAACESHSYDFFKLRDPRDAQLVFSAVRLLAAARDRARSGQALAFTVSMDDALGREVRTMAADNPGFAASIKTANPEALVPMTDEKFVLAHYPMDKIVNYYQPNTASAPTRAAPRTIVLDAGGYGGWIEATLLIDGGRIVRLALKRFIPPPF